MTVTLIPTAKYTLQYTFYYFLNKTRGTQSVLFRQRLANRESNFPYIIINIEGVDSHSEGKLQAREKHRVCNNEHEKSNIYM